MAQDNKIEKHFFVEVLQSDNLRYVFPCGLGKYRATVQIRQGGAPYKDNCDVTIYGVSSETLRQISYLLANPLTKRDRRNRVRIWVGGDYDISSEKITGSELAFQAETYFIAADFTPAPNIALRIVGAVGCFEDSQDAGTEMEITDGMTLKQAFDKIIKNMEWNAVFFNGQSGKQLANKKLGADLLQGATWYQRALELANKFNLQIRFENYNIIIAKYGESLYNTEAQLISSANGLISYPTFTNDGVSFRTLFNNNLKVGDYVDIYSSVPLASNEYKIGEKVTTLSSEPNGQWQTQYIAFYRNGADFNNL